MSKIDLIHGDCMDYMRECPDNAFDLAIVDPPYFPEYAKGNFLGNGKSSKGINQRHIESKHWSIPDQNYFDLVVQKSVHQIIWGINYFNFKGAQGGAIIWDKKANGVPFSEAEIAYTSKHKKVVMYRQLWMGCMREGGSRSGIHPCEKPVKLYDWLLRNYAEPGQRILDTHLGSGSSAIAAHYFGCDFVGIEIDEDYYKAAVERFNNETRQETLF